MNKFSNGEIIWTRYRDKNGQDRYVITSKSSREYYYLYECVEDKFNKLGRSRSPKDLEEKFNIEDTIKGDTA